MSTALATISSRIVHLNLWPGAPFTEVELASSLELSKTPVREALLVLSHEGLVHSRPGTGYRVAPVTIRTTRDICRLRGLLEGEAAALAAARPDDEAAVLQIQDYAELVEEPYASDEAEEFHMRQGVFHGALVAQNSGNPVLAQRLAYLVVHVQRLCRFAQRLDPHALAHAHEGHVELAAAIGDHDPEAARQLAVAHAETTERLVVEALLNSEVVQGVDIGGVLHKGDGPT